MRPGTGERDIEMVTRRLGGESAHTGRARSSVGSNPVTKLALRAHEATLRGFGVVPTIAPLAVDHDSHNCLVRSRRDERRRAALGWECREAARRTGRALGEAMPAGDAISLGHAASIAELRPAGFRVRTPAGGNGSYISMPASNQLSADRTCATIRRANMFAVGTCRVRTSCSAAR